MTEDDDDKEKLKRRIRCDISDRHKPGTEELSTVERQANTVIQDETLFWESYVQPMYEYIQRQQFGVSE